MAFLISGFLNAVGDFFTKPLGHRDCGDGYIPGIGDSALRNCFPDPKSNVELQALISNGTIFIQNPESPIQDQKWERMSKKAATYGVADSGTCPPVTIPFNGSCLQTCPIGMEPREYQEPAPDSTAENPTYIKMVECRAACNAGLWHALNWASGTFGEPEFQPNKYRYIKKGSGPYLPDDVNQQFRSDGGIQTDWCFRQHMSRPDTNTEGVSDSIWPYGLYVYDKTTANSSGEVGGPGNTLKFTEEGHYATRHPLQLGQPEMAGPCPPPNIPTKTQCLKPPGPGFTIVGNRFVTTTPCPANYSKQSMADPTVCIPQPVYRERYRSLQDYLISLIIIALIIAVIAKFVK